MKKVLKIVGGIIGSLAYVFVILVCAKQAINYLYNEHVLKCYANGDYTINENLLLTANYLEPYIVYYNNANIEYQNKQYEEAIKLYKKALKCDDIPADRKCDIYINMALCQIGLLPDDYEEYENIPDSIEILEEAKKILFEDDCATEDGDGHSEIAEDLKEEIDEEIERLEKKRLQDEQEMSQDEKDQRKKNEDMRKADKEKKKDNGNREQDGDKGTEGETNQEKQERKREENLKKQLEESSEEAYKEHQEKMNRYKEQDAEQEGKSNKEGKEYDGGSSRPNGDESGEYSGKMW